MGLEYFNGEIFGKWVGICFWVEGGNVYNIRFLAKSMNFR
jgi:hypothetical protein